MVTLLGEKLNFLCIFMLSVPLTFQNKVNFLCVFSPTEIKISHTIFLSTNWTVNQNSEIITCQSVNTLIQGVEIQTLSSCILIAASKIFVSENWKNVSSCEFLALKNEMSVSGDHLS